MSSTAKALTPELAAFLASIKDSPVEASIEQLVSYGIYLDPRIIADY